MAQRYPHTYDKRYTILGNIQIKQSPPHKN